MASKISKACQWTADGLNEYAAAHVAGADLPNHSPSSPLYWFMGLARETRKAWEVPALRDLLTQDAINLLPPLEAE